MVPALPNTSTHTSTRSGMIERRELIAKAAAWVQARGWKARVAKKRGHEQSMFEHSRIKATPT